MRLAILTVLVLIGAAVAPAGADAQALKCTGSYTNCLAQCTNLAGVSREDCAQMLRRAPRPAAPSVAVQPNTSSKYKPVPQGKGGSQQPGPYVNPQ